MEKRERRAQEKHATFAPDQPTMGIVSAPLQLYYRPSGRKPFDRVEDFNLP